MLPAAWLATRTRKSGSNEITPLVRRARITASAARSASTAAAALGLLARAERADLVVERDDEKPISSCGARLTRFEVAFAAARAGDEVLPDAPGVPKMRAPYIAASSAISSTSDRVSTKPAGGTRSTKPAVLLVSILHGAARSASRCGAG
jgi:hypothetical protein